MFGYRKLTNEERDLIKLDWSKIPRESGDSLDWTLLSVLEKFVSLNINTEYTLYDKDHRLRKIPLTSIIYDKSLIEIADKIYLPNGYNKNASLSIKRDGEITRVVFSADHQYYPTTTD